MKRIEHMIMQRISKPGNDGKIEYKKRFKAWT